MNQAPSEVSVLLAEAKLGRSEALERLLPLVYQELRRIAANQLRRERTGHTLQPTELVHEAFLRLTGSNPADWQNRAHFFAIAAQVMRRLLVDYARRRSAQKRLFLLPPEHVALGSDAPPDRTAEILAVNQILDRLETLNSRQARIVELRYFAGLSVEETAEAMGLSERTVKGDWAMARAWLRSQLRSQELA